MEQTPVSSSEVLPTVPTTSLSLPASQKPPIVKVMLLLTASLLVLLGVAVSAYSFGRKTATNEPSVMVSPSVTTSEPQSVTNDAEGARGSGGEADWLSYVDSYHGYSMKYPKEWMISPSTCADCAANFSSKPFTTPDGQFIEPSSIGILVFDTNSPELQQWRNTNVIEKSDFSWTNLQGELRIEKRNDFFQLGEEVQMEVLYAEKGSKTVVIYVYPSILPAENAILSTFSMK